MHYYPEGTNNDLVADFKTVFDIKQAMRNCSVVEGRVLICDRNHNLHLDLGPVRGIIPRLEGAVGIAEGTVRDIALISKVGKRVCFKIIGFHRNEDGEMIAVLSRRMVQLECLRDFVSQLCCGDVIDACVTHLEKFGAFIDIGAGINSLIPIDMLSVSRIDHPQQRLYVGETIRAVLRKKEPSKITFSLKELLGTWYQNADAFAVGTTVTGIVRSIEDYGIFVELAPNLAGLAEPRSGVFAGQRVSVFVKSIIPEKMKIKLVIVECFAPSETPSLLKYFEKSNHIDSWTYSTPECKKRIFTDFSDSAAQ